ncbi:MAG: sugar phosphate isomerase/epimerase [Pirellulales bacterium]|nr:sugar phosphate isomerase/epimerase [Pirellulales bacterium]
MEKWPLGVFASIDAGLGVRLEVAHELGIPTLHLHAPSAARRTAEAAAEFQKRLDDYDLTVTAVFGGFEGESYADISTVARTVGLVPPETRSARLAEMKEIADFAAKLSVPVVALHLGCIEENRDSTPYREIVNLTQDLCGHCAGNSQALHLETGQETSDGLLAFLGDVDRDNLFVNFDPANMILYGTGDPIPALQQVGAYVRSVHCKDGCWSNSPGVDWGQEVALGTGDVNFAEFLRTLNQIGYAGPLTIEREIPQQPERQRTEIGNAVKLLQGLRAELA